MVEDAWRDQPDERPMMALSIVSRVSFISSRTEDTRLSTRRSIRVMTSPVTSVRATSTDAKQAQTAARRHAGEGLRRDARHGSEGRDPQHLLPSGADRDHYGSLTGARTKDSRPVSSLASDVGRVGDSEAQRTATEQEAANNLQNGGSAGS